MRGPSKSLPKYRKHKRSGQAIVTLGGKDIYLGPHGTKTSKNEYDRLIGEWLANGRSLPQLNPQAEPIKVSRLAADYWKYAKSYYVKNGRRTCEQAGLKVALRYVKKSYGRKLVTEFGPLALEAIRNEMINIGNSRRYINQNIGRIKRMFRWGVARQIVPVEVYQALACVDGLRKGKTKARESAPILPVDVDGSDCVFFGFCQVECSDFNLWDFVFVKSNDSVFCFDFAHLCFLLIWKTRNAFSGDVKIYRQFERGQ